MAKFKKQLSFWDLVVYGIGIIVGAGIYVLIAPATELMGNAIWISFLLATFVVILTGISYAHLSSKYAFEAAEYFLVKKLTKSKFFSFLVAWLVITAQMVAIAAVALGFSEYLSAFLNLNVFVSSVLLIFFVTVVNLLGVEEVSRLNFLLTSLAVMGLLVVIFSGIAKPSISLHLQLKSIPLLLKSTALIFFSFIGFESIVNLGSEAKNSNKTIPIALISSVIFSGIIYTLVAISAVSVVNWKILSSSSAPLVAVAEKEFGKAGFWIVEIAALFSTASTVLILSVVAPRMIWGLSREGFLPKKFSTLRNSVPVLSTIFTSVVALFCILLLKKVNIIAEVANFNMLLVYAFFNCLSFKFSKRLGLKLTSSLGVVSIALIFAYLDRTSILVGFFNLLLAFFIYRIFESDKN